LAIGDFDRAYSTKVKIEKEKDKVLHPLVAEF
jgi:hypothetical protein